MTILQICPNGILLLAVIFFTFQLVPSSGQPAVVDLLLCLVLPLKSCPKFEARDSLDGLDFIQAIGSPGISGFPWGINSPGVLNSSINFDFNKLLHYSGASDALGSFSAPELQ
jgi:hypothetical protein